jgi:peptide/nickel transport system permease protein
MGGTLRQTVRSRTGLLGLVLVVATVAAALLAPWLATHDPTRIDVLARFASPSAGHWLGTDHLGRDLWSRVVHGARIAMLASLTVILLALAIGTALGVLAAWVPPRGERLVLVVFDVITAFPSILLALAMVAVLGPSLPNVILIVTITLVPHFGRVARAQTLALRYAPFVEAERGLGASTARILVVHVLPNILGPLAVLASMDVPVVITIEAGLSFLGVGVRPPRASWGTLLFDGYAYLSQSLWPVLVAGLVLSAVTLGFTLFGEALRDAADPTLRRQQ